MAQCDPNVPDRESIDASTKHSAFIFLHGHATNFVRSPAFIAAITELLEILHNSYISQHEAYVAVRRTARILNGFVDEAEQKTRSTDQPPKWGRLR